MNWDRRWTKLESLGKGGQGEVFRAVDKQVVDIELLSTGIQRRIRALVPSVDSGNYSGIVKGLKDDLQKLLMYDNPISHGALKLLHDVSNARDPKNACARVKNEIRAMSELQHRNLLKLLDHDEEGKWYVSEFHQSTLDKCIGEYSGNVLKSLVAVRSLVEGVVEIHKKGFVHRDIKPQNVFVNNNGEFVLGDFGLVFYEAHTARISDTFENVGTRDWMPAWAYSMRIEEVRPSFDVFSLGKILWALVSTRPVLPLWYFKRKEHDLITQFPDSPHVKLLNEYVLQKCIVENEEDCLPDASALLEVVDRMIGVINKDERWLSGFIDYTLPSGHLIKKERFNYILAGNSIADIEILDFGDGRYANQATIRKGGKEISDAQVYDTLNEALAAITKVIEMEIKDDDSTLEVVRAIQMNNDRNTADIEKTVKEILGLFRELSIGENEYLLRNNFYARTSRWGRKLRSTIPQAIDLLVEDGTIVIVGDDLQLTKKGYNEVYK